MVDWLKRLARDIEAGRQKPTKVRRTLYVSEDNYDRLADHCAENGWAISEVVDRLIEGLLSEIEK